MKEIYCGLMSGTSLDAIDAVIVDFSKNKINLIASHNEPLSSDLKKEILDLTQPGENEINRLGQLDVALGEVFANAAQSVIKKSSLKKNEIRAIGSHGQTIRHQPHFKKPFTLQIGDPNTISELTGITTISDFRRRDMAAGGQGAPLAPAFHQFAFQSNEENRIVLNIGGMANITILPKNNHEKVIGFDTGPGNVLLNTWIEKHRELSFDKNGDWARSGKTNDKLLSQLLSDDYFLKPPPKSTGREHFNLHWLKKYLTKTDTAENTQATLLQLTAQSIHRAIIQHAPETQHVLICGGGAHNTFLLEALSKNNYAINSTAQYGIDPDWVEAIAFAWLAKQTLNKNTGNLPTVTGAKKSVVLGGIY